VIRRPTVLILGAGASKPYGYALGTKLVEQILARTHPDQGALWPVLTIPGSGYSGELVLEFRKSLEKGRPASIDDFLAANVEFRELGKVCIAAALTVFGPTDEGLKEEADWLEYLWWRLHDDALNAEKFKANRLKIITYNYDTSFERYFRGVLSGYYADFRNNPDRAEAFRARFLPTENIHGSLGPAIDELRSLPNPQVRNQITWYKQAASDIRILNEGDHTDEYKTAHEWIQGADVIYFLGFGYHQTNTTRLDLRNQITATVPGHPDRIVRGTAVGLGEAGREDVVRRLNIDAETVRRSGGLLYQLDSRTFLEMHGLA